MDIYFHSFLTSAPDGFELNNETANKRALTEFTIRRRHTIIRRSDLIYSITVIQCMYTFDCYLSNIDDPR